MAVVLTRRAEKDVRGIDGTNLDRIERRFLEIDAAAGGGAKPPQTKSLTNTRRGIVLRTRAGDYRILWVTDGHDAVVIRIIHRSDLDRVADSL